MGKHARKSVRITAFAINIASLIFSLPSNAQEPVTLHFAGIAVSGTDDTVYPNTEALIHQMDSSGRKSILDTMLADKLSKYVPKGFSISFENGNADTGDSLAFALVVSWEHFAVEQIDAGVWKTTSDIQGTAMVFDVNTKKMTANYPFIVEYRNAFSYKPTVDDQQQEFYKMFHGNDNDVLDDFINAIGNFSYRGSLGNYARVDDVTLSGISNKMLESSGSGVNATKQFIASQFNSYISINDHVQMLPYVLDSAIGNTMAIRFSNGNSLNISIPEPDYKIYVTLNDLKKIQVGSSAIETEYAYANYFHIKVANDLVPKPYLDADFKYAVGKVVLNQSGPPDDWAAFQESIAAMMNGLTKQFAAPDPDWIGKWGIGNSVGQQIAAASEKLATCR